MATETLIPARGLHNPVLPSKMSSQAKVKKDKEIIAEYETQVKGWYRAGLVVLSLVCQATIA